MADPIGSAARLLPHRGTARLLTEVVRSAPGFVEATGSVSVSHPLSAGNRVPSFLGLELGAQAAAALEALSRGAETGDGGPRVGYLVRIRTANFLQPYLPVDTPLGVTARLEGAAPPLAIYRISITVAGVEFVHATLSTHSGTSATELNRTGSVS